MDQVKYAPPWLYGLMDGIAIAARGRMQIEVESDWKVVDKLIEVFWKVFPEEGEEFIKQVKLIRATRANRKGNSKTGEIRYTATLPFRLERLIKRCFPLQQFDKKFIYRLILRYPLFRVGTK